MFDTTEKRSLAILMIDDDEVDRFRVRRFCSADTRTTYRFAEASSAAAARSLLESETFDCIFLDFILPDADGAMVLTYLRSKAIDVPVIVLTGHGREDLVVDLLRAGAADYLSKDNLTSEGLLHRMRYAIQSHRMRKEAEHAREEAAKIRSLAAAKSDLMRKMNHEFKTPLNAIIGYSDLLIEREVVTRDTDLRHEVEQIRKAGNLLLSMVQKLLELEQCETETWDLSYETVAIAALVNEVLQNLTPLNLKRQNQIVINVPETLTLSTDRSYLIHILTNLLDNAIKFTENGIVSVNGSLAQIDQQDNIVLTIADTGIGIDTQDLPHVFEAFYQASASMTWPFRGAGIGLSVCREYTQRLGGTLTVESTLGTGTIFTVVLPRSRSEVTATTEPSA